jgi:D-alanyl-D-alanine carboxypeptidase
MIRVFQLLLGAACICWTFDVAVAQDNISDAAENAVLMAKLVKAYPEYLKGFEGNEIIWRDGTRMIFDDGIRDKPFETLLDNPSLRDQFAMRYPQGEPKGIPAKNFDPGRVRHQPFFEKMYGRCETGEVQKKLVTIDWLPAHGGGKIQVTTVNGIHNQLRAVSFELEKLPDVFMKYLRPPLGGILACRTIGGTTRKSMHAYAAAVDINTTYTDYWRWGKQDSRRFEYRNRIPYEIASIFEKHGFIWGAKWYHFDTMHFEYRPELFPPHE